ncbi:hypothetical protein L1D32_06970 [Shewanella insulae]|uniref:Uncharacterized protein n=1 Tax=Shewanella insulae TaxID=2681496 RepID=A0A6L7I1U8_9GAMM|nr:hypothetical protein [Shewanella insulae]MCG9711551.1 hypothetical protein [Shewanella insulae]MCG9737890.1 hypothetical protein [Shewanella insulae]MXR70539.1 hypothetical protein [Shewanella insulae]
MKNIPIHASIEGQTRVVDTDWLAIMATLKERGLEQEELVVVYAQLNSYLRVTTRGLTLAMIPPSTIIEGLTREIKHSANDYARMLQG